MVLPLSLSRFFLSFSLSPLTRENLTEQQALSELKTYARVNIFNESMGWVWRSAVQNVKILKVLEHKFKKDFLSF